MTPLSTKYGPLGEFVNYRSRIKTSASVFPVLRAAGNWFFGGICQFDSAKSLMLTIIPVRNQATCPQMAAAANLGQ